MKKNTGPVQFTDNSAKVIATLNDAVIAYLNEAGGEIETQAKRNTRVDTGQTKGSWSYVVDEAECKCTVGNTMENAIWEEFGTGEYALKGDGRKGGWRYWDEKTAKWVHTVGKKPSRAFQKAFTSLKPTLVKVAKKVLKARMK